MLPGSVCPDCALTQTPPAETCGQCRTPTTRTEISGAGHVLAATTTQEGEVVVLVELDAGARIWAKTSAPLGVANAARVTIGEDGTPRAAAA